jgi:4-carboxymuconolactone decarboxylase
MSNPAAGASGMPERLTAVPPVQLTTDQKDLYDSIVGGPRGSGEQQFPLTDASGALIGPFGVMIHAPVLGHALQELGAAIRYRSSLSGRSREIAILQVAAAMSSEFEQWAHERVGIAQGLSDQELAAIREGVFTSEDTFEQACYELVADLLQNAEITEVEFERIQNEIGRRRMLELVVLVGYYRTLSQAMQLFEVRVPAAHDLGPVRY